MARKTLTLAFLALMAITAHAQHFDWVKTYSGQGETHKVISSFADNDGNLYILGHFTRGAQINGVDLLPLPNANPNNTSIVIAKLTADGNLAWHKSIYSSRTSSYGYCMKPIGSNRFIVMAIVSLPYDHGYGELNDLYYLDTLLTGNDNYLVSFDSCTSNTKNIFITFDFNGNVVEQHFVELGYLDNFGQPITPRVLGRSNSEKLSTSVLSNELFGIDNSGHIYVARTTVDLQTRVCDTCEGGYRSWTIENGTIGMLKIMVDDTLALYCPTEPSSHWNQQVLVFSPHLDSIVGNFYVFDSTVGIENIYPQSQIWSINIDNQDNVYITVYGNGLPESVRIARSEALHLTTNSCMIKYNPSFFATNTVQLSSTPDPLNFPKLYGIRSTYFDYDTRSLFIMGEVQRDPMTYNNPSCHILYSGDTLDLRNNAMWLRLDMDDMHLISYGKATSSIETSMNDINGTLAIKNNRVFSQILYQGDILWLDTTISIESTDRGMGLMAWDYEGHEIAFYDFNAVHINNRPSQTHIVDSVLYMTGMLFSGATFGNLDPIPAASGSQAFIARYTDTAFMTPYINPRINQTIAWTQPLYFALSEEPIWLNATCTSGLPITYTIEDTAIAIIRNDTLFLRSEGFTQITASQSGNSAFYPAEPVTRLLQINSESIDITNESKVRIYPNPAKDALYFVCDGTTISEITLFSSDGRMTKLPYNGNFIDISTLSTGIYYLIIVSEHEVYKHKIVKL